MKVFVTGGTGYVGQPVVRALVEGGHELSALTRSREPEPSLLALGVRPVLGDLRDTDLLYEEAQKHEAVIHIGLDLDDPRNMDRTATLALLDGARERAHDGIFIYTSGCWVLGETKNGPADETAPTNDPAVVVTFRPEHERAVLEGATVPLATAVIRPGLVYGGRGGLVSRLFETATSRGAAEVIDKGDNHWSLIHRDDLATLFRLVLEQRARGVFHGVDGHPTRQEDAARAASEAAGKHGAVQHLSIEEARDKYDLIADALRLDQSLVARRSSELGFRPQWKPFVESAQKAFQEWSG